MEGEIKKGDDRKNTVDKKKAARPLFGPAALVDRGAQRMTNPSGSEGNAIIAEEYRIKGKKKE